MQSEANPAVLAMMASGDAERIASGSLAGSDVAALNAVLAQVDSMKATITKLLASRMQPTTPSARPATPAETPEKSASAVDSNDDAAMQLD